MAMICESEESLRKAIYVMDKWCFKNKMKMNKKKSFIVHIPWQSRGRRGKRKLKIGDYISGIEIVKAAKYLGLIIDSRLMFEE